MRAMKSAPPERGLFFWGFSMKWMLLLVLLVIGVGTLMGKTAPPVLKDASPLRRHTDGMKRLLC